MPQKQKTKPKPLKIGKETIGQRIARMRKERGYSQAELSKKVNIIQALVSDYERDRLRLHAEIVVRFAKALKVSSDELLGIKTPKSNGVNLSLKLLRRVKKIEELPQSKQKTLLRTIDIFLKGAEK